MRGEQYLTDDPHREGHPDLALSCDPWDEVDDRAAWDVGEHDDTGPLPRMVV